MCIRDRLGTYPLPESQLDRFLLRITLGYPDRVAERELLTGGDRRAAALALRPVLGTDELLAAQQAVLAGRAAHPPLAHLQALDAAPPSGALVAPNPTPRARPPLRAAGRAPPPRARPRTRGR